MINLTFIRDQHFYVVEPGSQVWARVNYYLANQGYPKDIQQC
jgi:4-alpha-glucanotransferase